MSCRPPTRPGLPRQAPPQVDGAHLAPAMGTPTDLVIGDCALTQAWKGNALPPPARWSVIVDLTTSSPIILAATGQPTVKPKNGPKSRVAARPVTYKPGRLVLNSVPRQGYPSAV